MWRIIYTKVKREEIMSRQSIPREYKNLYELLNMEKPGVFLQSGLFHSFDKSDLDNARSLIPWYLHRLVKFPWVFIYRRSGVSRYFELVKPDQWAARALNYILNGDLGGVVWEINESQMMKLLLLFKTLIIVLLNYNLELGSEEVAET
jgi:uncharacterized protein (UPF0216 family)